MKFIKIIFTFIIFSYSFAQEKIGDIISSGNIHMLVVAKFDSANANEMFQRNVGIMTQQSATIENLKKKISEMKDGEEKTSLSNKLKQLQDEFDANEKAMQKYYSFSVDRQYKIIYDKTNIIIPVSDTDIENLRKDSAVQLDPDKIFEKNGKKFYRYGSVIGAKNNDEFQRYIHFMIARQIDIKKLRDELSKNTEPKAQLEISEKIASIEKALKEKSNDMFQKFNLNPKENYAIEVEKSRLLIVLTPEEIIQMEQVKKSMPQTKK